MKTTLATTQFDQPNLAGAPATPSCCCCCCCCLTTVVSASTMTAMTVNGEATARQNPGGVAALLAVLAQFVGMALLAIILWLGLAWPYGVLAAVGGAICCWFAALRMTGLDEQVAWRRALKYAAVYAAAFALEFAVGFVLVLMYVIPYVIVALFVGTWVIGRHRDKIRLGTLGEMYPPGYDRLEPNYILPPPPVGDHPESRQGGPVAEPSWPSAPTQ